MRFIDCFGEAEIDNLYYFSVSLLQANHVDVPMNELLLVDHSQQMEKKALRQILCVLGGCGRGGEHGRKADTNSLDKAQLARPDRWRLILGGGQNDTPMRRAGPRRVNVDRAVFRVHSNLRAAISHWIAAMGVLCKERDRSVSPVRDAPFQELLKRRQI
jgi:hypothetical protein